MCWYVPATCPAWRRRCGGLIERPDEAAALGDAARRTVDARFSFDRMVDSFENLYLDLLDRRTATSRLPLN